MGQVMSSQWLDIDCIGYIRVMGQVMSSQWLDIDCIVLHQSDRTSNEFTIA